MNNEIKESLENLRNAIQDAEQFGLIRTQNGGVVTGAIEENGSIVLTKD